MRERDDPTVVSDASRDGCLKMDELVAMVEGTLAADHSDPLIQHIDRCADCAEIIANLGSIDGPARRIDRYQIERVLGTGGMGIVYAVFDPELQRRIAIKLVRPDKPNATFQALMLREARALARVSHPNVVGVYDVGEHDGEIFLATELVDGTTLGEWQVGRSHTEIIDAWLQVARGLAAAHAEGVVHRDVKPANILIGRDGRVRIGDFGIAHLGAPPEVTPGPSSMAVPPSNSTMGLIAGTPAYMAPEQTSGRVDARADQFATCVGLAEALTGTRPKADDTITLSPPALAAALTRGLRSDPAERFPTMIDFADAVVAAIAPPPVRPRARKPLIVAAVAASGIAAASIVALATHAPATTCTAATIPDAVWSPARRQALAVRLPVDGTPVVERWVRTWTTAAGDVCTMPRADDVLRIRRERCLADMLSKLDQLLRGWEAAPPRTALAMHIALEELPHAAWCSRAAVAATIDPPAAQRDAIAALESELEAQAAPGGDRSTAALAQLLDRARAIGHAPLVRQVALAVANRQAGTDQRAAIQTLRAAIADGPNDFAKVVATLELTRLLGVDELAEVETLVTSARATIAALGGDVALEAELDMRLGQALSDGSRNDEAISALERARNGTRIAHGDGSPQEAQALILLASAYYQRDGMSSRQARAAGKNADEIWARNGITMPSSVLPASPAEMVEHVKKAQAAVLESEGPRSEAAFDAEFALMLAYQIAEQPDQALAHGERARELGDRLGLRSPRGAVVRYQTAMILIELGRANEALPFARDAVSVAQQLEIEGELASARVVLGEALIETGQTAAASEPLRAALKYLSSSNQPARLRAHTRFLLARATWESEPTRAIDAARVARAELESALDTPELDPTTNPVGADYLRREAETLMGTIDRWLGARR